MPGRGSSRSPGRPCTSGEGLYFRDSHYLVKMQIFFGVVCYLYFRFLLLSLFISLRYLWRAKSSVIFHVSGVLYSRNGYCSSQFLPVDEDAWIDRHHRLRHICFPARKLPINFASLYFSTFLGGLSTKQSCDLERWTRGRNA